MVSYMRGKIADMDAVKRVCDERGVTLLEDCAHSICVLWDGVHTGPHDRGDLVAELQNAQLGCARARERRRAERALRAALLR